MHTPSPSPLARPPLPDLTPAPAVLKALAHVAEVDLVKGLGRQRLAQVIHDTGPLSAPRASWRVVAVVAAVAAPLVAAALYLALR